MLGSFARENAGILPTSDPPLAEASPPSERPRKFIREAHGEIHQVLCRNANGKSPRGSAEKPAGKLPGLSSNSPMKRNRMKRSNLRTLALPRRTPLSRFRSGIGGHPMAEKQSSLSHLLKVLIHRNYHSRAYFILCKILSRKHYISELLFEQFHHEKRERTEVLPLSLMLFLRSRAISRPSLFRAGTVS